MSKQLDKANEAIENVREELADLIVKDNGAFDIERGYELLHKIKELSEARDVLAEIDYARRVLDAHGVVYKVWTREDVLTRLEEFGDQIPEPDRQEIADHVTEGDDWKTMAEVTADDEVKLWGIIRGTSGDHPEWFPPEVLERL